MLISALLWACFIVGGGGGGEGASLCLDGRLKVLLKVIGT